VRSEAKKGLDNPYNLKFGTKSVLKPMFKGLRALSLHVVSAMFLKKIKIFLIF